jgi:beta-glucanase (GH16 family)
MRQLATVVAMSVIAFCFTGVAGASAATPHQAAAPGDCGPRLSKPGGGAWVCTFVDNFNGTSLNRAKWLPLIQGGSGVRAARTCFVDSPNNVAVAGGTLRLTVRKVARPVVCDRVRASYTSASITTYRMFSQQYGRFEARMKVNPTSGKVPGLQEAFWLWPDDRVSSSTRWPASGEIDIAELYSQWPQYVIPFLHYKWNNNGGPKLGLNTAHCAASRGVFNTYTLTWTATSITIQVNGKTCLVNTSGDRAFKKPYILAFSSMLGVGGNALKPVTPIPATMQVDSVKVWR